jgi:ribose/xylose/arabinose/galactoside ABC-type transport system permease subunit
MKGPLIPRIVLTYGVLGLIPFLAPPLIGSVLPGYRTAAASVLALYGALILSFLGGARWGLAVGRPGPDAVIVSLAMLPSLVGLALLLMPDAVRLPGLAAALALHWLWDISSSGLPAWYPRLRSILTAGALPGLVAGTVVLT